VARQAGRGEYGEPCRGDLLVRAAVAADVFADPGDVEERVRVLGKPGGGVCADGGALFADAVGRAEVWVENVAAEPKGRLRSDRELRRRDGECRPTCPRI
jgi:hypothetical protein